MEFSDGSAREFRLVAKDGIPEEEFLCYPVPLQVVHISEAGRISICQAEVEGSVPERPVPSALPGVFLYILAAKEVEGVLQIDPPYRVIVGDGGDVVVRHALRNPVPALHHGADPAFLLVRYQIRPPGISVAISLYQTADYVHCLTRAAGLLDCGGADLIHQGALRTVLARKALVGGYPHTVLVHETVARLLARKFEPEISAAAVIRRHIIDVEHLFAGLVFVMAEIHITVGRGIPSGDNAETEDDG